MALSQSRPEADTTTLVDYASSNVDTARPTTAGTYESYGTHETHVPHDTAHESHRFHHQGKPTLISGTKYLVALCPNPAAVRMARPTKGLVWPSNFCANLRGDETWLSDFG